jgi:hypothetical protein
MLMYVVLVVPPSSIGPHELVLYTIIGFHSSFHSLTVLSPDAEASTVEETSASALTHLECPVRVARQVCVCRSHSLMLLSHNAEASTVEETSASA